MTTLTVYEIRIQGVMSKAGKIAKRQRPPRSHAISGVVGGILLVIGLVWMAWIVFVQRGNGPALSVWPFSGTTPTSAAQVQIPPIFAEGITLHQASQPAKLSQQQALLIAGQLEPDAAKKAKNTSASYVLFSYPNLSTPATHAVFNNVPAWLVWYQKIPLEPADASVDPTPFPHSVHDLYVFLDADSGKELLSIWI